MANKKKAYKKQSNSKNGKSKNIKTNSTKQVGQKISKKTDKFPHFRRYKKNNHPALIVGEYSEKEYKFRKVTHNEKEGKHLNEKVFPNPDKTDPEPMYINKRIRHDKKNAFDKILPWKYKKE